MFASNRLTEHNRPGDTTKLVAKAWKPWRKRLLATTLAADLASRIRYHSQHDENYSGLLIEIDNWTYGGKELLKLLAYALEMIAQQSAAQFKRAERDGTKRARKRFRNQLYEVDQIGQALGFEKLDWKKQLGS